MLAAAARFEQARVFLDNDRGSELYCTMLKECALHLRDGARDYALKQLRFSIRREPFWIKAEKDAAVKFRFLKSSSSSDSFFKVLPPPPPRSCYNRDSLSSSTYSAATIYSSDFECHLWLLVAAARDMKRTLAEMWEVYECMRNMFPTTRLPDWVFDVMMYRFENVYAMNLAGKEWEEKIRPRLERERHANLFI